MTHTNIDTYTSKTKMAAFLLLLLMGATANTQPAQARNFWGAVAYNAYGAAGVAWSRFSRWDAERAALARCNRKASVPCKVLSGANYACGAVAHGRRGSYKKSFASIRATLWAAGRAAMNRCVGNGNYGCHVRIFMCADGRHT